MILEGQTEDIGPRLCLEVLFLPEECLFNERLWFVNELMAPSKFLCFHTYGMLLLHVGCP